MIAGKIGFIGTGTITDAIARGLFREPAALAHVVVSERNAEIASKLARDFRAVTVAADNQSILENCDTLVLAVRPQTAEDVVRSLSFRGRTAEGAASATWLSPTPAISTAPDAFPCGFAKPQSTIRRNR
ncbi:hypothetical protein MPL3365_130569 [Mesorhizobium plurifarium]|uniref:Pyrroline-5-carboxylate reductase catalytic N-terminal domain-containing protein n=1 Tax=Mesorhizobium plurifarium TaxID=69974 RepID=A0A090FX02_MESPL|nr:hypothetical protein MPL3365_130569 [Mesorhizobium plurifarium]